jgi:hypothetical protein
MDFLADSGQECALYVVVEKKGVEWRRGSRLENVCGREIGPTSIFRGIFYPHLTDFL